ncbi:hypothetical protein [Methyloglobulus sp.]|uniref:hypothetical protein n=1 Tax=Methyloglobulus sp. TaxID=2518622 RepID=UPI0039894E62
MFESAKQYMALPDYIQLSAESATFQVAVIPADTVLKSKNQGLFHFAQRGSKGLPDLRTPKAM